MGRWGDFAERLLKRPSSFLRPQVQPSDPFSGFPGEPGNLAPFIRYLFDMDRTLADRFSRRLCIVRWL